MIRWRLLVAEAALLLLAALARAGSHGGDRRDRQ